jgi:hypothetical protein
MLTHALTAQLQVSSKAANASRHAQLAHSATLTRTLATHATLPAQAALVILLPNAVDAMMGSCLTEQVASLDALTESSCKPANAPLARQHARLALTARHAQPVLKDCS